MLGINGDNDVGIDVKGVATLVIDGVASEGSAVPLRVRGVVQCSVTNCSFEAWNAQPAFDIEISTGEPRSWALSRRKRTTS
ncbi:hypothetical protein [Sorangium sp. So ce131]|uniref:hypothetical protein n=1 Tax=Sorangium sp. So ce131 TaxID=3133282 RepID=UPI003F616E54